MPMVKIYVFTEPRSWKNNPAETIPFMYDTAPDLRTKMLSILERDGVYHITAFNTYSQLIMEVFKSKSTRGKVK